MLLCLPGDPFSCEERKEVSIGKTPYARFDLNDYSVPAEMVQRSVVVLASTDSVRILDGLQVIASHQRSYDRGRAVEETSHFEHLKGIKREAGQLQLVLALQDRQATHRAALYLGIHPAQT